MRITIDLDPILLEVGGFALLRWYSIFITLAIFAAVWLISREFKRKGLDSTHYGSIATWAIVLGIIGARLFHVIDRFGDYSDDPLTMLEIQRGGLAIWGAVAGGFIGVAIGCWRNKMPLLPVIDAVAPGLVLAQAIGRFGNIVNGDAWGAETTSRFAFIYTNPDSYIPNRLLGVPTHPYPVYDMALNLAVFALLMWLRKKPLPNGALFAIYLVVYGIGRFIIHGWFREEQIWAFGMQQAEVLSLAGVVVGLVMLAVLYGRRRTGGESEEDTSVPAPAA